VNEARIQEDLAACWEVLAEPIQTVSTSSLEIFVVPLHNVDNVYVIKNQEKFKLSPCS
jgi:hypothetical protein